MTFDFGFSSRRRFIAVADPLPMARAVLDHGPLRMRQQRLERSRSGSNT